MNAFIKSLIFFVICSHMGFCARSQNVLSVVESIAKSLPFSSLADSLVQKSTLLKQPLLPAEQQSVITNYNRLKMRYQETVFNYLAQKPNIDTGAFLVLNYFFNIQKDSGFLRHALDIWNSKKSHSFYTQYIQEELNGLDSAVVGKVVPSMFVYDKMGMSQSILTHKKTLLIFWASWCIPCRAENRDIISKYQKISQNGITITSINLDETKANWTEASNKDKIPWTDWFAETAWNSRIARFFTIHQIPQNVLLDDTGKILARNIRIDRLY